ncbi:hypothetical protein L195_g060807 [Trifolium pratense]|uniref:Uncharacterized protein n=1 Tax=Trifolium pratense TaxID=57577 RepID=A0A2K3K633_TRIPR|nr:hypothetical protein L195_g060807 [Trifolium pratense]
MRGATAVATAERKRNSLDEALIGKGRKKRTPKSLSP